MDSLGLEFLLDGWLESSPWLETGLHTLHFDSYTMFLLLQFSLLSEESQGGHGTLLQCGPFPKSLSKEFTSTFPPASWYLILNPVISAILFSSSFKLFIRVLPLVLGKNRRWLLLYWYVPPFQPFGSLSSSPFYQFLTGSSSYHPSGPLCTRFLSS